MKPMVVTLTGPSASGKSTLERMLVERTELFGKAVSTTTRLKREGEASGIDYYFIDPLAFNRKRIAGEFIETVTFNGINYGVTADELQNNAIRDKVTVLVVEPNGAKQIRSYCRRHNIDCLSYFITNKPSILVRRFLMRDRITESNVAYVSNRLVSLLTEEVNWIDKIQWDGVIEVFNENTEDAVIELITDSVKSRLK